MTRREEEDRAFNDAVYDAWRSGKDPDLVSRDRFDDRLGQGYYADEIRWIDCYPKHQVQEEE